MPHGQAGTYPVDDDLLSRCQALESENQTLRAMLQAAKAAEPVAGHLLSSTTEAFLLLDSGFRITFANPAACRINEKPASALIGKTYWEEWPGSVGTAVEANYRRAMSRREPVHFEHHYRDQSHDVWLEISAYPVEDGGLALHYYDISSRIRGEQSRRRAETINQRLLDSRGDRIEMLDLEGRAIESGSAWATLWRNRGARYAASAIAAARAGRVGRFQAQPANSRKTEWWDIIVTPVPGPDGTPERLIALERNITRWRAAEAEARENRQWLDLALDAAHMATWDIELAGMTVRGSGGINRLFGFPDDKKRRPAEEYIARIHPDDRETVRQALSRAIEGRTEYAIEYRTQPAPGEERWLLARGRMCPARRGSPESMIGAIIDITAQKEAEHQLSFAQRRFQAHVENTPLAVVEFSCDYSVTRWTARAEEIFGWSADEMVGRHISELTLVHEDDVAKVASLSAAMASGDLLRNVHRNRNYRKDGSVIHCAWYNSALLNAEGKLESVFSLVLDETEQVRAEQEIARLNRELARRVNELETIVDIAPIGLGIACDAEARDIRPNRRLTEVLALERPTNVSKISPDGDPGYRVLRDGIEVPPENLPMQRAARRNARVEGEQFDVVRSDGVTVRLLAYACPLVDDDGTPRGAVGAFLDITNIERERLERERLLAEHAWYRGLLEALLEHIPEGLAIADAPDGRIRMVSRHGLQMVGGRERELVDVPMGSYGTWRLLRPDGTLASDLEIPLGRALTTGAVIQDEEWVVETAAGGRLTVLTSAAPMCDSAGGITGAVLTWRDISDRKRMEQELRSSNADLLQFAYAASHDLQEPLRMMAAFSQLLQRRYGGHLGSDADQFIDYIVTGAKRLEALLRDLLVYSRTGREGLDPEPVDCNAALEQAITNLQAAISGAAATVTSDPLPTILAYPAHVVLVFQNLIGNAIKYRKPGVAARVHITSSPTRSHHVFTVSDNGIGIDPAHRDIIFGIFKRLHRDEYEGTGLGLSLCKRIVETYGGCIWVESEPGQGSRFHFSFPRAAAANVL